MVSFKRYEYWSREGKVWSKWFPYTSDYCPRWQLDGKLKNEYK
jgi:hypothetical protein